MPSKDGTWNDPYRTFSNLGERHPGFADRRPDGGRFTPDAMPPAHRKRDQRVRGSEHERLAIQTEDDQRPARSNERRRLRERGLERQMMKRRNHRDDVIGGH